MQSYFVYILKCNDGSYYTGHTDNLEKRISEHNNQVYESYTASRLPFKLVYTDVFSSRDEAFIVERKIKNWSKRKKAALISKNWHKLSLYAKKEFIK